MENVEAIVFADEVFQDGGGAIAAVIVDNPHFVAIALIIEMAQSFDEGTDHRFFVFGRDEYRNGRPLGSFSLWQGRIAGFGGCQKKAQCMNGQQTCQPQNHSRPPGQKI